MVKIRMYFGLELVMKHRFLAVFSVALALSTPASADPTIGLGLTFTFGGASKLETGIGLRVFSDNARKKTVGTLGLDYMFQSQRLRPSVGLAYLGSNAYLGVDLGYDFGTRGFDVGLGVGGVKTRKPAAAAPAPTTGGGGTGAGS